ncbi:conserved domain protein [Verrucomicrobiia bacterium DG1235]|nr:conserved domain protein [Verrucomicrobiae bacterium DG1235]
MKSVFSFSRLVFGFLALNLFASLALAGAFKEEEAIFNGKDLGGWVVENGGQFSVREGTLRIDRGTGWLRSEEVFGDFALRIEFRFLEEGANSGIFVRTGSTSHESETGYPNNGYQIQCFDTLEGDNPIATLIDYGAPPFEQSYDLEDLKKAYRPAGEWQSYDIVCVGESMKIWYNGSPVVTAGSIKNLEGHVGIQGELGLLEFRKFEITRL